MQEKLGIWPNLRLNLSLKCLFFLVNLPWSKSFCHCARWSIFLIRPFHLPLQLLWAIAIDFAATKRPSYLRVKLGARSPQIHWYPRIYQTRLTMSIQTMNGDSHIVVLGSSSWDQMVILGRTTSTFYTDRKTRSLGSLMRQMKENMSYLLVFFVGKVSRKRSLAGL